MMSSEEAAKHAANMNRAANELIREMAAMVKAKSPPDASPGSIIANLSLNMMSLVADLLQHFRDMILEACEKSGAPVDVIWPKRPESGESTT